MSMILRVEELKKHFPRGKGLRGWKAQRSEPVLRAVDGVSLAVDEGETLGLVGESGCGKTTLARCILRLIEPTSGRILFRGTDLLSLSGARLRRERRRLQAVFQDPYASLNPRMTVQEILTEPLTIHGIGARADRLPRAASLLREVGLDASALGRRPAEFSGGQRQRLAIARALCLEPDFILADEPISSLDVSVQGQILQLLTSLKRRHGMAMLFISHSLPVVQAFCDRVAVMRRGRLVEVASPLELFSDPLHPYTRILMESVPLPDPSQRHPAPPLSKDGPAGELREVKPGHWVAS